MTSNELPSAGDSFKFLNPISIGVSASVYKARCLRTKSLVAIKIINRAATTQENLDKIHDLIHNFLIHDSILKPHFYSIIKNRVWVIMPYVPGGSLQSIINYGRPHSLSAKNCIRTILQSVVQALETFHGAGLAHKGVKPGNILLDEDGNVMLSDFGVSSLNYDIEWQGNSCDYSTVGAAPYWVSPEILSSKLEFDIKSDIWCLGITALELLHGCPPCKECKELEFIEWEIAKRFRFSNHYKKGKSKGIASKNYLEPLTDFISNCLKPQGNPFSRPSTMKLLGHHFFSEPVPFKQYLVLKLLYPIPDVEDRYSELIKKKLIFFKTTSSGPSGGIACRKQFLRWEFNANTLELEPVYNPVAVRFGDMPLRPRVTADRMKEAYMELNGIVNKEWHIRLRNIQDKIIEECATHDDGEEE